MSESAPEYRSGETGGGRQGDESVFAGRQLEDYRRLLRWYPRRWRERNGEAFIGSLLDEADAAGWSRVDLRQRVRIASSGIALRFALRSGGREAATAAILLGTVLWGLYLALIVWSPGHGIPGGLGPFSNPMALAAVPWLLGIAAVGCRLGGIARGAFSASCATVLGIGLLHALVAPQWYGPSATIVFSFALLALVAALDRPVWRADAVARSLGAGATMAASMTGVLLVDVAFGTGSAVIGVVSLVIVLTAVCMAAGARALRAASRRRALQL